MKITHNSGPRSNWTVTAEYHTRQYHPDRVQKEHQAVVSQERPTEPILFQRTTFVSDPSVLPLLFVSHPLRRHLLPCAQTPAMVLVSGVQIWSTFITMYSTELNSGLQASTGQRSLHFQ